MLVVRFDEHAVNPRLIFSSPLINYPAGAVISERFGAHMCGLRNIR